MIETATQTLNEKRAVALMVCVGDTVSLNGKPFTVRHVKVNPTSRAVVLDPVQATARKRLTREVVVYFDPRFDLNVLRFGGRCRFGASEPCDSFRRVS